MDFRKNRTLLSSPQLDRIWSVTARESLGYKYVVRRVEFSNGVTDIIYGLQQQILFHHKCVNLKSEEKK